VTLCLVLNGYALLVEYFFLDDVKQDIRTFGDECDTCQRNKGEIVKPHGTLQPLMIPPTIWMDISIDFIVGYSKSSNKSIIMVVVGHLSKFAHLCYLQHSFTTPIVAQIFMDNIFKLHGLSHSIVYNRDPNFTNYFWQELFRL
jgi:hypothetical protein